MALHASIKDKKVWAVPVAANGYFEDEDGTIGSLIEDKDREWKSGALCIYFYIDKSRKYHAGLVLDVPQGTSKLTAVMKKDDRSGEVITRTIQPGLQIVDMGVHCLPTGYLRMEITGINLEGGEIAKISDLLLMTDNIDARGWDVKYSSNQFERAKCGPSIKLLHCFPPRWSNANMVYSRIYINWDEKLEGGEYGAIAFAGVELGARNGPKVEYFFNVPVGSKLLKKGENARLEERGIVKEAGKELFLHEFVVVQTKRTNKTATLAGFVMQGEKWELIATYEVPRLVKSIRYPCSFLRCNGEAKPHNKLRLLMSGLFVRNEHGEWFESLKATSAIDTCGGQRLDATVQVAVAGNEGDYFMEAGGYISPLEDQKRFHKLPRQQRPFDVPDLPMEGLEMEDDVIVGPEGVKCWYCTHEHISDDDVETSDDDDCDMVEKPNDPVIQPDNKDDEKRTAKGVEKNGEEMDTEMSAEAEPDVAAPVATVAEKDEEMHIDGSAEATESVKIEEEDPKEMEQLLHNLSDYLM